MSNACPVNSVDGTTARIVAGIVVALAAISIAASAPWIIGLLAADFIIRGFIGRQFSPLRWVAKRVQALLRLAPHYVYAPPKRFAAHVGVAFTVIASVLHLLGLPVAAIAVTGMLIVAASLEACIGFCLACWVYPYVGKFSAR